MSDVSATFPAAYPSLEKVSRGASLVSNRALKLSAAALLILAGGYGVLTESGYITTSNAIMSAYVLDVRTPIEGEVTELPVVAGEIVRSGQLLGHIRNSLITHEHLDNLLITERASQAITDALGEERQELKLQRSMLLQRANLHMLAMRSRLDQQLIVALHALTAKRASVSQADTELRRETQLYKEGIVSRAESERFVSSQQVLSEEALAAEAQYHSLLAQREALGHGVLSEQGTNNDVSYSTQRADDVTLRLLENVRASTSAAAQARQAHTAAEVEAERNTRLASTELRAPHAGLLWKLNAVDGEHVAAGATVLALVDCERQFVLAEIPQDRLSSVVVGGHAQVRFTGESSDHSGTVIRASGDPQRELDLKLAATPAFTPAEQLATVLIRLDAEPHASDRGQGCLVGRSARVRIPTTHTNLIVHWLSEKL